MTPNPGGDQTEAPPDEPSLREKSLSGASKLAAREVGGIAIRLVGVVLVTRIIGPHSYGIYAGAFAFVTLMTSVSQQGVEVHLIRQAEEPDEGEYADAITFLLLTSTASVILGLAGSLIAGAFFHSPPWVLPFQVLLISVPVNVLWAPAQARLERAFQYQRLAFLEVGSDIALYAIAVPLALAGAGVWSPIVGWIACQTFLLIGSYALAHLRPTVRWNRSGLRAISNYTLSYSTATWAWNASGLINPVIVGSQLGATAVGIAALATRLVDTLGFVIRATWRLALVAIARVQDDQVRLRRGIEDGMAMQVLLMGSVLAAFAVTSSVVVPLLFGHQWQETIRLFPYLATQSLLGAVFLIPTAVLRTKAVNRPVLLDSAIGSLIWAALAVPLVHAYGLTGFGVAAIGRVASSVVIDRATRRIVDFSYRATVPWLIGLTPLLYFVFAPYQYGALMFIPLIAVLVLVPGARRQLRTYFQQGRHAIGLGP